MAVINMVSVVASRDIVAPRQFHLWRHEDESGVSGTGRVAEGILFTSGKCALCWLGHSPSVEILDSIDDVIRIHGHQGKTAVVFD